MEGQPRRRCILWSKNRHQGSWVKIQEFSENLQIVNCCFCMLFARNVHHIVWLMDWTYCLLDFTFVSAFLLVSTLLHPSWLHLFCCYLSIIILFFCNILYYSIFSLSLLPHLISVPFSSSLFFALYDSY